MGVKLKKTIHITLLALFIIGSHAGFALAADDWEMNITVNSGNAENRLSLGQNQDATDQRDGLYDVPAMLSGTLRAWFASGANNLWRDIRSATSDNGSEWQLLISSRTGLPTVISWNTEQLPAGMIIELVDNATGTFVDMSSNSSFLLEDFSEAELTIKTN